MELTADIRAAAQVIWDYHHVNHELRSADAIWVLCSHDLRVADRAVELFEQSLAPLVIFSGGFGNFTDGVFEEPEADLFAERARELGVPELAILRENQSTNCGENVLCTQRLLAEKHLRVESAIAVQKPYMERRTLATIGKQWPELSFAVTSPRLGFGEYCTDEIPMEKVIGIMVGDFQRLLEYPKLGFQTEQPVSDEAREAFEFLVAEGFTWHLMKA
ncbi:MAG: YdcF family protein [Limisphaerales bacterium]